MSTSSRQSVKVLISKVGGPVVPGRGPVVPSVPIGRRFVEPTHVSNFDSQPALQGGLPQERIGG
eukprot:6490212-Prymnesium_polylepis.1